MNSLKQIILENKSLRWLLLFTNWVYQGIPQADFSEKIYKISFTVIVALLIILSVNFSWLNLFLAIIIGHTVNWLLNCNISVILIHRMKYLKTNKEALFNHLFSIKKNLEEKKWFDFSVSSGGIIRGSMNKYSDIDVNVVRKSGFLNALKAICFAVFERKRADFKGIPLDVIISDSPKDCQEKTDFTDTIVVLVDKKKLVPSYFNNQINLSEAKELNNKNNK
ncbi:hypothetical protein EGM88_07525 [Aureibaculum marinum]|uniref:Uncharacterized protein n=1 Tax=Aureibaculum marinum TaxID=2487930 RepID=A0A3N4NNY1_9FLAO|nr:hypothetical protein [Aureibaculum marinum]RPD98004.1 hypothetical protein EGM88_07525 [Aureibaculum marinum]